MDDIQFQFSVIISPIQFLCGLFSSIISIIVFNKSELKNQSTKSYLIITYIINIVTVTYLPFAIIPAIWDINDLDCKIYIALSLLIAQIQPWVLALSSLDRLVFIVLPTRYLFRKKIIFQIGICTAALLLIVITITPCVYPCYFIFYLQIMGLIKLFIILHTRYLWLFLCLIIIYIFFFSLFSTKYIVLLS